MIETPLFFQGSHSRLFGVLHEPASHAPGRLPFVFCHPFGEEKLWAHRVFVTFARTLAGRGHVVLRFDYMGNGDSEGPFERSSVSTALDDITVAIDWLQNSPEGFDSLRQDVRDGLLANAATVGPTFAVPAPRVACAQLRGFRAPSLVLYGDATRLFFRRVAERAAACLPGATLRSVPGCGHMSIVENPPAVAALLRDFFRAELPARSPT